MNLFFYEQVEENTITVNNETAEQIDNTVTTAPVQAFSTKILDAEIKTVVWKCFIAGLLKFLRKFFCRDYAVFKLVRAKNLIRNEIYNSCFLDIQSIVLVFF